MTGIFMDANADGRPHWKQNNKKNEEDCYAPKWLRNKKKKQQQQLENKQ